MSVTIESEGVCLCGKVSVSAKTMATNIGACHCGTCRKWNGGPFMTVDCGTEVDFSGEASIAIFESSEWAERGFCSNCGTHLFYKLKQNGQYIMPVDLFDHSVSLEFDHQVFVDEKPKYYSFANETKNMTGEEVFAQFAGE